MAATNCFENDETQECLNSQNLHQLNDIANATCNDCNATIQIFCLMCKLWTETGSLNEMS